MSTADVMMPQFAYWDIDDSMINQNTKIHAETNNNLVELMYPLIKLDNNYDKQPDEKIILIIGDSFVWDDGSSNVNVLWWRMLQQRMLDEGFGKCRIVAVGLNGASTQDQLYWLENTTMIEDIKPDMIIIGYVVNDPDHCEYTGTYSILHKNDIQNPAMWTPHNRNMNHWWDNKFLSGLYLLFPNIERKFQNDLDEREINMTEWPIKEIVTAEDGRKVEVDVYNNTEWELKVIEGANLERYNKVTIEPLGKFMKKLSIPCVLMTTPHMADYDYFYVRYKNVMPLFRNAGISVYDCLDDLTSKHSGDIRYMTGINPVNYHPSIPMNKYYADYAFNMLAENYPEILGPRNTYSNKNTIVVNDWFPYHSLDINSHNIDRRHLPKMLNPSVEDNKITFTYSDEWEHNKYLYLPMNAQTVKLCFENPVNANHIIIKNSDGSPCNDFTIWESHIGSEGFEELNREKISSIGDGKYNVMNKKITSLNLHRSLNIHGEKTYTIAFE